MITTQRRLIRAGIPALVLVAVIGLAGCAAGANDVVSGPVGVDSSGSMMAPEPAPLVGEAALDGGKTASTVDRSVITTGWATILVDDPEVAADDAVAIVDKVGGRVDGRTLEAPTDYTNGSATLTIRVPSESLDDVLTELKGLGRVQSVSTNSSDVTVEVQDLDARITALRSSIERLTTLQDEADSVDSLIALETAISDRQAQLESLEAQQRYYDDQVSLSTLTIDFVSQTVLAEPEPGSFWGGIQAGWVALVGFFSGLIVVFGVLVPWLIPVAVIGAIVWISIAASRRKRRNPPAP